MKTILLTGGTGFIGSNLIPKLLNKKYNIVLLKRSGSDTSRINEYMNKLICHDHDKIENLDIIFTKNEVRGVIHLATKYIKNHPTDKEIEEINEANINFPSKLLNLASKHNCEFFINTGTCFEYKPTTKKITESSPVEPFNYYASTKIAFEDILKFYSNKKKMKALTLKLFYPYGEKDNDKLIPYVIAALKKNKTLKLTPAGQKLNFTYIRDITNAYIEAVDYIATSNFKKYEAFNIGTERTYSVRDVVKLLAKISNKTTNIQFGAIPYPENEIMYMNCDSGKAKKYLGWEPMTTIEDGLLRTYNYFR